MSSVNDTKTNEVTGTVERVLKLTKSHYSYKEVYSDVIQLYNVPSEIKEKSKKHAGISQNHFFSSSCRFYQKPFKLIIKKLNFLKHRNVITNRKLNSSLMTTILENDGFLQFKSFTIKVSITMETIQSQWKPFNQHSVQII